MVRPRARRLLALGGLGLAASMGTLLVSAHLFPSFGAALADGVRAVAGPEVVAWAEDVSYDAADRVKTLVYADAAPKQFWAEPTDVVGPLESVEAPKGSDFAPPTFEAPWPKVAGKSDGTWVRVGEAPKPVFFKTVVHPDEKRSFAAVAVVAVDLTQVALSLVAGTVEPVSTLVTAEQRPGLVAASALPTLLAAFNGGFKAEHGHYGMMVDKVVLLPTRERACTIALMDDGSVKIGADFDAAAQAKMRSLRQTPPCLVVDGVVDDRTSDDGAKRWGAAVGGATVIRRSALGVSADGKTLFYGLGDSVTAGALARAMKAAGADDVAQLDVNAAYPRFVFYTQQTGEPTVREALIPGLSYEATEYVRDPEPRDFFTLTSKAPSVAACFGASPPQTELVSRGPATTKPAKANGRCKGKKGCRRSELPLDLEAIAA